MTDAETIANHLAKTWIEAWNARDLERVLALFADACTMTSPKIVQYGHGATGAISGKKALRAYWTDALARAPALHFTWVETHAGPDCAMVLYDDQTGRRVSEFLRWNADGLVVQAVALHRCMA